MRIAVVIPARDSARLLIDCLATVLSQTRPADEVLVVVGPSHDNTRQLASAFVDGTVRVLDNPSGDRGSAINAALDATDADLLAMVDTQSRLEADYLEAGERVLADPSVAVAGGPMRPLGSGSIGQAMAAALQSPFGVGDSQFHFVGVARDVESVYLGIYRRTAFDRVGRYNPALLRTEDDDLNARIRQAGMRIRLDPTIRSIYRCRETLADIWRQYHGYGFWKAALAFMRRSAIQPRHVVPAAFLIALAIAAFGGLMGWWLPLVVVVGAWALAAMGFAILAPASSLRARMLFPLVTLTMHLGYGTGTLIALAMLPRLGPRVRAAAEKADGERE